MTLGSGIAFAALMVCTAYVLQVDILTAFLFVLCTALPLGLILVHGL
ncbi:hypothetical protein J2D73_18600 [Acetobacter sacchari]|uniref:Uncharacterized protein n=1 Tax=Acetobacter sacchari TaxID=2661687 RepID=A0ABS3M0S8_9PROT|nr:hypothetical protein [Acetobacter sacchari]MBO1361796.1 hypothetical protein [Acetobacter sacchari]